MVIFCSSFCIRVGAKKSTLNDETGTHHAPSMSVKTPTQFRPGANFLELLKHRKQLNTTKSCLQEQQVRIPYALKKFRTWYPTHFF